MEEKDCAKVPEKNPEECFQEAGGPKKAIHALFDFTELFAIAIAIILLLFTFVLRMSVVVGGSMKNTLQDGDRLLVSDLFYTPERNDIVVVQAPYDLCYPNGLVGVQKGEPIVKRVIAVAGDTVEVRRTGIYVNGELANGSEGIYEALIEPNLPVYLPEMGEFVIPEGQVYIMGDHRTNSFDSRYFGTIDARFIIGRAFFRIAPLDGFGAL